MKKHPLETNIALDNDFHTFKSFRAWAIPAVYIFDKNGCLVAEVNVSKVTSGLINEVLVGKVPAMPAQMGWSDPAGAEYYFRALRKEEEAKR